MSHYRYDTDGLSAGCTVDTCCATCDGACSFAIGEEIRDGTVCGVHFCDKKRGWRGELECPECEREEPWGDEESDGEWCEE